MLDIFATPFTDEAARRALVAIVVLSFGSAPIGVFLMLRRMSLMGDAMSHAILPGVAVAFLLTGMNRIMMTIGGLIAGLVVAVLSGLMTRVTEMKEDASLAVFYLVSLALGVTLVTSHGSSHELIARFTPSLAKYNKMTRAMPVELSATPCRPPQQSCSLLTMTYPCANPWNC